MIQSGKTRQETDCGSDHELLIEKFRLKLKKVEKIIKLTMLSKEALQIAKKRREAKAKGEKERYIHLNAEFQRIARRDETAFLSDQCKGIEENNRMGTTRSLQEK